MECKTCGSGQGLVIKAFHMEHISTDGSIYSGGTLTPTICDCCGGYWESCINCERGERVINWTESMEDFMNEMGIWLDSNIDEIIYADDWIMFSECLENDAIEEFMRYFSNLIKRNQTSEYVGDILKELIPGNARTDIIVLARRTRLAMVQVHYDKGHITEKEARELLNGNLSGDKSETYYDDSALLQVKENEDGKQNSEEE